MRTLSGAKRSSMAVPSAKNSGLDRMSNLQPGLALASRMVLMDLCRVKNKAGFAISQCDGYKVGLGDTLVNLGREEQVPTPASLDDVDETGLVNGEVEVGVVPGVDSGLVDVNDGDLDVRTLEGAVDQELHRMSDMYMKSSICEHSSVFHSHNGTGGTSDVSVSRSKNKHSRDQPIALPKQRLCNLAKTTKYTLSTKTHPAPIQTI